MTTLHTRLLLVAALALAISACKARDVGTTPPDPVTISVSPAAITLDQGAEQTFHVTVSRGSATFSLTTGGGTIDGSGLYKAPYAEGTATITAISDADTTKKATAAVTIRQLDISVTPSKARIAPGAAVDFTAAVANAVNTNVTWSSSAGAIDASGHFVAPSTEGIVIVTATSAANSTRSATAAVTVTTEPPPSVTVAPATATLDQGATQQFTATVAHTTDTSVTWSIDPDTGGTISSSGLFTAGALPGVVTVTATSVEDPTASGQATVVINGVTVTVTPGTIALSTGGHQVFTATVTGSPNQAVTWSLAAGAHGSIDASGDYTAPAVAGADTVIATSVADPSKSGTATATVAAATRLAYTDPTGSSWRLMKNVGSTDGHLVLDLFGPSSGTGRGVAFTLAASQAQVIWTKVTSADATLVKNVKYALGSGTALAKGSIKGDALAVGVFQKGNTDPAVAYDGPLVSIAVDLKPGTTAASGTAVALTMQKAQARNAAGAAETLTVALGALVAQ